MAVQKTIFISHSTNDRILAGILVNTAVTCGVAKENIFCSSYKGTDVKQQISPEVKEALKSSKLDIIILSNDYKRSTYCLNEAGIIWYKSNNYKLIISLPDIFDEASAGFISTDYIQCRLSDANFCNNFISSFISILSKIGFSAAFGDYSIIFKDFTKQINKYIRHLSVVANLASGSRKEKNESDIKSLARKAQINIREMFNKSYMPLHLNPTVFYENYIRCIELNAVGLGMMEVKTITTCKLINLSNHRYTEVFSSQFLSKDGGAETFSEDFWVDGEKIALDSISETPRNCAYIIKSGPEIIVEPHKVLNIEYITSYQIAPERFFQSKLIKIPCGNYKLRANFSQDFADIMKQDYIFRFQVIPCVPHNLQNGVIPISEHAETTDKHFIAYSAENGFPAGGGYAIAISKN